MFSILWSQVVSVEAAAARGAQPVEQQQQQVLVALAPTALADPSAEVMEVKVFGLLDNSVAFICEEKSGESEVLAPSTPKN